VKPRVSEGLNKEGDTRMQKRVDVHKKGSLIGWDMVVVEKGKG